MYERHCRYLQCPQLSFLPIHQPRSTANTCNSLYEGPSGCRVYLAQEQSRPGQAGRAGVSRPLGAALNHRLPDGQTGVRGLSLQHPCLQVQQPWGMFCMASQRSKRGRALVPCSGCLLSDVLVLAPSPSLPQCHNPWMTLPGTPSQYRLITGISILITGSPSGGSQLESEGRLNKVHCWKRKSIKKL